MLAKKTAKNQITIPESILRDLPNTDYLDVSRRNDEIVLRPVAPKEGQKTLRQVRAKVKTLGITQKDIDEAIRRARER